MLWSKLPQKGNVPKPRSGHTLTYIGGQTGYLMYGGIEDAVKDQKIMPTNDIYSMKLYPKETRWEKESPNGDEKPPARAQHIALTTVKNDRIFIFGGHSSPTTRLNDAWWLKCSDLTWSRVMGDKASHNNDESHIGAPTPRANAGCCYYNGKFYVYGGHGGLNYARVAFNDVYSFDIETEVWSKHEPVLTQSPIPPGRGGHSIFAFDDKLYCYGGWNSESQFNNIVIFDLNTSEWSDPDIYNDVPRWNHSAIMVEAIPSWKYFIFGGESTMFNEGQTRTFGQYVNTAYFLDIATMRWSPVFPENSDAPSPREYAAIAYDTNSSRLLIFGGWNNGWMSDFWTLNVSKIVGPSYAITEISPPLGQLSGGVPVVIKGCGFKDQNIKIYFTCGKTPTDVAGKNTFDVPGVFVSETEVTAITPNYEAFGPKDAVVQLSVSGNDLTTTWVPFSFFMNTRALKSLAFGPGLLKEQAIGEPVEFVIQARNDNGENRKSGRDGFMVAIKTADKEKKEIPCEIQDMDNGQYFVKYQVDVECDVEIVVTFVDDKGKVVPVRGSPYSAAFKEDIKPEMNGTFGPCLPKYTAKTIEQIASWMKETSQAANIKDKNLEDIKVLISVLDSVNQVNAQNDSMMLQLDQLEETLNLLLSHNMAKDSQVKATKKLFDDWTNIKKLAKDMKKEITPLVSAETQKNTNSITKLEEDLKSYQQEMKKRDFYKYDCGREMAQKKLDAVFGEIADFESKITDYGYISAKLTTGGNLIENAFKMVDTIKIEVTNMKGLWDHISYCQQIFTNNLAGKWEVINCGEMEDEVKKLQKTLKEMKVDKKTNAYNGLLEEVKKWLLFLPLIAELRDPSMRERHWQKLRDRVQVNFVVDSKFTLRDIWNLNLNKYAEDVEETTDQAKQEAKMEKTLNKLNETWKDIKFQFDLAKGSDVQTFKLSEENFEMLEENQQQVSAMLSNRFVGFFEEECTKWNTSLANISEINNLAGEVQRQWSFLENLFLRSEEVKKELPKQAELFVGIDKEVKRILADCYAKQIALIYCDQPWVLKAFTKVQEQLTVCEKALNDFMDSKRTAFPRFYFVSPTDLLDILSNGSSPAKIMQHMPKIFQAIENLELKEDGSRVNALGMHTNVGQEYVQWTKVLTLQGKVETYMQDVIDSMRSSLKDIAGESLVKLGKMTKEAWLKDDPAQTTLLINILVWTRDVEEAFGKLKSNAMAMKDCHNNQIKLLSDLIKMVQGDLSRPLRMKLMCMITMDAHSRDIIGKLYDEKVLNSDEFQWQSQLKVYWDQGKKDFQMRIADAVFWYGYEYLGNGPRLVITPLTDRIYVTATQALHLSMGCAPAGPAGTGKTETTKDLSSALAKAIYVFNCSDQMDYKSMGGIFKGLASSGSWGCFDEFNRLVPAVLSVCSVQFKSVTDAIRGEKSRFTLQGDELSLDPTCGAFITMNPGYLGRSELPEGLKALFRPITVVVPDLCLICENMLMSEGFIEAKILAEKFTTLYFLCRDLLSKAAHYDWGLRAIKSVLVVAGSFKRSEPGQNELAILLRALRDFNIPKIVAEDTDIFTGLLSDLFPGINVPRNRDMRFEGVICKAVEEAKLCPDENFILKVVQLGELLVIRHCVFTMGPPGAGKSSSWKMLAKAQTLDGKKTMVVDLNPKVVSTNELYGIVHIQTREWIDGLMSKTLRSLSQIADTEPKWIILDGDLDANWIESMNSVMDDNKILTLASNERIVLKPHMRLIFEIRNLKFATPATVSRAGILYIADSDGFQWRAYIKSWIQSQKYDAEVKKDLNTFFEKYVNDTLTHIRKSFKYLVPVVELSLVMCLCKLLEALLVGNFKGLEYIFVFACVWSFGAGFSEKDNREYRKEFSNWWKDKWKTVKFAAKGTVFDYYVDIENTRLEEWQKLNTKDVDSQIDTSKSISSFTVPTVDTISAQFLMRKYLSVNYSPLLVGNAGCGKTQIIKGLLNEMTSTADDYLQQIINFNFYTDSTLLQNVLESMLEKKAGKTYAPLGKFKLLQFIDDLNMPQCDPYETQTAISLVRQHKDYEHWYDRQKLMLKDIKNTQFIGSMNPTAGSFFVDPRLQRWFWICAIQFPDPSSLNTIYSTFLNKHFSKFKGTINELISPVIKGALQLHTDVTMAFRKTAINFHYEFNVRHLTNIFQGLLVAKAEAIKEPDLLIKLWVHESERIYGDRLVSQEDLNKYRELASEICKKSFSKFNLTKYFAKPTPEPLTFAYFVAGFDEKLYDQFPKMDDLALKLRDALRDYNEMNAQMDLVLFDDAMKHVCKITRIISADQGHALLVGVGGSGKQSLSKLSAFICQCKPESIVISSSYGINDLKANLQTYYQRTGVKDEGIMFLFTEGQITNERFLVFINDLLSSGEIADLFPAEDVEQIVNNVRSAVKGEGIVDNKDNCWKYFIDRVKKNLHMTLCFSPVGDAFRNRARKFPALINCTVIDWFTQWPEDALLSVAAKFLDEVEMSDTLRPSVERFMPYSFKTVNALCDLVKTKERRYIYTTPKSFLELIKLFKSMLGKKKNALVEAKERYEVGVVKLNETQEIVSKLEEDLKISSVEVEKIKIEADAQATIVGAEKEKVDAQAAIANVESEKCAIIAKNVNEKMQSVQKDLDAALPLVAKAEAALAGLKVKDFQTLKALQNPPGDISKTFTCVLHLMATIHPDVQVDKKGRLNAENPWKNALKLMANPQGFLDALNAFKAVVDEDRVPAQNVAAIRPTLAEETFTKDNIMTKSSAAGGLCDWIINITMYYDVVISVEPKKMAVAEAQQTLAVANARKEEFESLVARLSAELAKLQAEFKIAMDAKQAAESEAARCASRLDLANRLVNALGSESERWNNAIITLTQDIELVVGDVLLASSFVSYVGPFSKQYREMIIKDNFIQFFKKNNIPSSPDPNPLLILTDDAQKAVWNTQKLPSDKVSTENAAILKNSDRYSLIIDPQLQGITWIREMEKNSDLQVTRLSNDKMVRTIEISLEQGKPVLIENLENSIDAVIQPVYGRAIIRKGKNKYIKLGDKELSLHDNFRLYLHTKLSNPHYPPEIQAECTLINFTVTEAGLEDQLLTLVVKKERPDLASEKERLIQQQNEFKITLKDLESDLLHRLATAEGDILDNIDLIENLERSKKLSTEINEKVEIAKVTEIAINDASEAYRPSASRGALVFFLLTELTRIHSFYKFSLDAFVVVICRAIDIVAEAMNPKKEVVELAEGEEAPEAEEEVVEQEMSPAELKIRVEKLTDSITYEAFNFVRRGTFERHKLIIATMLTFRIGIRKGIINAKEVDSLIKKEISMDEKHQSESLKFIPEASWSAVRGLEQIKVFENLIGSMESEALQWRKWYSENQAELAELPRAFKDIALFHRLLLLRAMRPDRLTGALTQFVTEMLGVDFVEQPSFDVFQMYKETNPKTTVFFVLFPGVDPTPDVERIGRENKKVLSDGTFINISMGQGQEQIALDQLADAGKTGKWAMFQNVHLMADWMKLFERKLEIVIEAGAHPDFRCFVSSEPPPFPDQELIPESILQNAIKIANEAPQDLKSNLRRAFSKFDEEQFERAKTHKITEYKAILFGLCMYHSLIVGRKKFGSQGWSRNYNFNDGDLTICGDVLHNYLTKYEKVPYADLAYIYGEIMYGGHITDNWDRRTNNTYLNVLIRPEILQQMQLTLAPGFKSPDPLKFDREAYRKYIEEKLPIEIPQMFGLHPNAEIGYLTAQGESLFATIMSVSGGSAGGGSDDSMVKRLITDFLARLPQQYNMLEIMGKTKDRMPYIVVCLQELERMNILIAEIRTSLLELEMGLKGQLNITEAMEGLTKCLNTNLVPANWEKFAYFSKKLLVDWFADVLLRVDQLNGWSEELKTPVVVWISGLFNPMSYLTAIMQVTARAGGLPLDDMVLNTVILNTKNKAEMIEFPPTGAFINGYFLEGAGWEIARGTEQGYLTDMILKDLHPEVPIVHITSIRKSERVTKGIYVCPIYTTSMRGPTYICSCDLKMESEDSDQNKWILAGCALLMSPE